MKLFFASLFSILAALAAHGGTITGFVKAEGKEAAAGQGKGGKYDSRKYKFLERVNYDDLRDFVVFIDLKPASAPTPPAKPIQVVTQKDGMFRPRVLPIVAGTIVEWPNKDEIFHNVFSISEPKPFDLGLYKDPEIKRVTFDKTGRVDVFCSIHTRMSCILLVLENPWFAAADASGRYTIRDVPAGTYKLKAWHERLPPQVVEIVVPEHGEVKADFLLGISNLPQY